jgi:hypothetical protein
MTVGETKAVKSGFRGAAEFGRTTTLINKKTGEVLAEGMGECTRGQLWEMYLAARRKAVRKNGAWQPGDVPAC